MRAFLRVMLVAVAGACMMGLLAGCAKAPDAELAAAKDALKAAQDAEADKYMPRNFENAQKALQAAEAEIVVQSAKFVLSRKYGKSKLLLKNATDLATDLKSEAPTAKADMMAQVREGLTAAQEMAKETRPAIKQAPRSKGKEVIAAMTTDLDTVDSTLAKAANDFGAGNIPDAGQKLSEAQKLLKSIFDRLKTEDADGATQPE